MLGIKIRNMSIKDLPTVFKIGVKEFDMTKIYHQYWNLIELANHLEKEKELCIIAELDGCVVGFALGRERYSSWEKDLGHLGWMAVRKILADVESKQVISKNLLSKFSFKKLFCIDWFMKEI